MEDRAKVNLNAAIHEYQPFLCPTCGYNTNHYDDFLEHQKGCFLAAAGTTSATQTDFQILSSFFGARLTPEDDLDDYDRDLYDCDTQLRLENFNDAGNLHGGGVDFYFKDGKLVACEGWGGK